MSAGRTVTSVSASGWPVARRLSHRSAAAWQLDDPGGIPDLERCTALCEADGSSSVIPWQGNLAFSYALLGDLRRCFAAKAEAWEAAERFGSALRLRWLELERVAEYYWSGRWDQAVRVADSVAPDGADGAQHFMECLCRLWRGRIRLARGRLAGASHSLTPF